MSMMMVIDRERCASHEWVVAMLSTDAFANTRASLTAYTLASLANSDRYPRWACRCLPTALSPVILTGRSASASSSVRRRP